MLYISQTRKIFTWYYKENGEFVINLTNQELAYATDWCGVKTGAKVDKFKEMHLHKEKANFVKAPLILESPVCVECKVREIVELGSHDMFIADVLSIDVDNKYIDENGSFDISKCNLIAYANGGYYTLGKKIGKFGYSVQKRRKNSFKQLTYKRIRDKIFKHMRYSICLYELEKANNGWRCIKWLQKEQENQ